MPESGVLFLSRLKPASTEADLGSCQTFMIELHFENSERFLFSQKNSTLDVSHNPKYATESVNEVL